MIRALLASPLGFLIGLSLGALGSGGSILAVPALVYGAGQTAQEATGTSLFIVGVATLSALPQHWRSGRVRPGTGVAFGLAGVGGSFAGTAVNRRLDPDLLLLVFSGLILVAAWRMLTACPSCTRTGEEEALGEAGAGAVPRRFDFWHVLLMIAAGTGVGFLTGLFGVGGGFVIVPALTLLFGFNMPQAIGTSVLIVAINAAVALAARLGSAQIDWAVAATFTGMAVVGTITGARIASRIDAGRTLRVFATALVVLALFTAGSAAHGLGVF